jgi:hypothetical protein
MECLRSGPRYLYWRRFRDADFLDVCFLDLRTAGRLFFAFEGFLAAESDFMRDRMTDSTAAAAATLAADFAALITWALALVMKLFFLAIYLSSARNLIERVFPARSSLTTAL